MNLSIVRLIDWLINELFDWLIDQLRRASTVLQSFFLPFSGLYFVVSPKDIVVAKPLDLDDVIDWLLERGKFDEAMSVATKDAGRQITRHNIRDIGRQYLEYLRLKNDFETAARVCPKILGKDKTAWEEQIAEFHKAGKLVVLAPYLPRSSEFRLTPAVYELVLSTFLQSDQEGFLRIVKVLYHMDCLPFSCALDFKKGHSCRFWHSRRFWHKLFDQWRIYGRGFRARLPPPPPRVWNTT